MRSAELARLTGELTGLGLDQNVGAAGPFLQRGHWSTSEALAPPLGRGRFLVRPGDVRPIYTIRVEIFLAQ